MSGTDYGGNVRKHTHGDVAWVDAYNPGSAVLERLEREYGLHPLHVRESVQKVQHNEVEREKEYLFLVVHFPLLDEQTGRISVGQLGMFLGKNYVITIHTEHSSVLDELFIHCKGSDGIDGMHSSGYLLYIIIAKLLAHIEYVSEVVDTELDEIDGLVFGNKTSDAERIGRIRQKIIRLRRLIGPKKILLQDLAEQIGPFAGRELTRYYASNVKMVSKLWEEIEEAKETIEIYKDADFTTSTERTNRILAILTLVFTFTIPVTVVGTLYGMNVPLPGGVTASVWTFLGRYTTFDILIAVSLVIAGGMYVYFRRKRWF